MTPKKIFIDLDETLISAIYIGSASNMPPDFDASVKVVEGLTRGSIILANETYRGILRPYVHEFLERVKAKYGDTNVYMLTAATLPYALEFNRIFNLGFTESRIYDRELIPYQMEPHRDYEAVLVDNLDSRYNESKIGFLNRSEFQQVHYIQIEDFYGNKHDKTLSTFEV
jgi:hypothetical protein